MLVFGWLGVAVARLALKLSSASFNSFCWLARSSSLIVLPYVASIEAMTLLRPVASAALYLPGSSPVVLAIYFFVSLIVAARMSAAASIRLFGEYTSPSTAFFPSRSVRTNVNIHLFKRTPLAPTYGNLMNTLFQPCFRLTWIGLRAVKFSFFKSTSLLMPTPVLSHVGGAILSPLSHMSEPLRSHLPASGAVSFSLRP